MRGADYHSHLFRKGSLRFTPTCVGQIVIRVSNMNINYRFTPTCVGQIQQQLFRFLSTRSVHPHMRGADFSIALPK